jgi:hypothetical protein
MAEHKFAWALKLSASCKVTQHRANNDCNREYPKEEAMSASKQMVEWIQCFVALFCFLHAVHQ